MRKTNQILTRRSLLLGFTASASLGFPTALAQHTGYDITDHFGLPKDFLKLHTQTPTGREDINYFVNNKTEIVTDPKIMADYWAKVDFNTTRQEILKSYKKFMMQAAVFYTPLANTYVLDRKETLFISAGCLKAINSKNENLQIAASIILSNEASHAIQISNNIFDYLTHSPIRSITAQVGLATELCSDCRSMVQAYELTNADPRKIREISRHSILENADFSSGLIRMAASIENGMTRRECILSAINHLWSSAETQNRQDRYLQSALNQLRGQTMDASEFLSAESFGMMNKSAGLAGFLEIYWQRLAPALLDFEQRMKQPPATAPNAPSPTQ